MNSDPLGAALAKLERGLKTVAGMEFHMGVEDAAKIVREALAEEASEIGAQRNTPGLVEKLSKANDWLNDGECCGQRDKDGVCAAPACLRGTAVRWLQKAADEISDLQREKTEIACAERNRALEETREKFKSEILAAMEETPAGTIAELGVRVGLAIAARIVERGRRLTAKEKLDNLFAAVRDAP